MLQRVVNVCERQTLGSMPFDCSVLQCVAVCGIVLQCVATCCSVLQRVVNMHERQTLGLARCSVLQRVAASCNVLQRVAACCKCA